MVKPIRYVEDQNLIEIRVDAKVILKLRSQDSVPGKPYELDLFVKRVDSDADDNSLVEVKKSKGIRQSRSLDTNTSLGQFDISSVNITCE